jgi:hypothetical protein
MRSAPARFAGSQVRAKTLDQRDITQVLSNSHR